MKIERKDLDLESREEHIRELVKDAGKRIGVTTSIDGNQLETLLVDPKEAKCILYETRIEAPHYASLSRRIPACHWQERILWNMFGLVPDGHPRLKQVLLHEPYDAGFYPLSADQLPFELPQRPDHGHYHFLEVKGDGVYEIPVGPIHAGIIEPGHFRFSCLGEVILNLEIRLGYVHRGVEKRMSELDWRKARFAAEAAATDSASAYALAYAECVESMLNLEPSKRARLLRLMALELERTGMHLADLGGIAGDVGFLGVAASFQRARGMVFRMAEILTGQRFLRAFICPGGVVRDLSPQGRSEIAETAKKLQAQAQLLCDMLMDNQGADDRMRGVGRVSPSLAADFGLVGIAGKACGIKYDTRLFRHEYPNFQVCTEKSGDVLGRAMVRVKEIKQSLEAILDFAAQLEQESGAVTCALPENLPANAVGISLVEAHRGELIHLAFTDEKGKIKRYCMKDPSVNNWTALAMAVRNNLVADFPLCNKSFALAYSGHDL